MRVLILTLLALTVAVQAPPRLPHVPDCKLPLDRLQDLPNPNLKACLGRIPAVGRYHHLHPSRRRTNQ